MENRTKRKFRNASRTTKLKYQGFKGLIAKYFWRSLLVSLHCGILYVLFNIFIILDYIAYILTRTLV